MISEKLCECGCGGYTLRAPRAIGRRGIKAGDPNRFIVGHSGLCGRADVQTRGATPTKYRRNKEGDYLHRAIAEKALGKPLPSTAHVHHADGTKRHTSTLVICQDAAYHALLHRRMRIVRAGGNPNTDKICGGCQQVKSRTEFHKNTKHSVDGLFRLCKPCKITTNRTWQRRLRRQPIQPILAVQDAAQG